MVLRTRVGWTFLENLWPGKEGKTLVLDLQRYWERKGDIDLAQNNKVITSSNPATRIKA